LKPEQRMIENTTDLIEMIEGGHFPSHDQISSNYKYMSLNYVDMMMAFNGVLNSAWKFQEDMYPDTFLEVQKEPYQSWEFRLMEPDITDKVFMCCHENPARAYLLATLRMEQYLEG